MKALREIAPLPKLKWTLIVLFFSLTLYLRQNHQFFINLILFLTYKGNPQKINLKHF
ncbi:MAG: hypothetical protein RBG13Loki_1085 [Promethearchaeota archaeon CR_4]|nr:MAG: hypothetical protein RBG13Loki_1085 [Candidatus Lokiarchaeota archaeon CR_4]